MVGSGPCPGAGPAVCVQLMGVRQPVVRLNRKVLAQRHRLTSASAALWAWGGLCPQLGALLQGRGRGAASSAYGRALASSVPETLMASRGLLRCPHVLSLRDPRQRVESSDLTVSRKRLVVAASPGPPLASPLRGPQPCSDTLRGASFRVHSACAPTRGTPATARFSPGLAPLDRGLSTEAAPAKRESGRLVQFCSGPTRRASGHSLGL